MPEAPAVVEGQKQPASAPAPTQPAGAPAATPSNAAPAGAPAAPRFLGDTAAPAKAETPAAPAAEAAKPGDAPKPAVAAPAEWALALPKDAPISAEAAKDIETFAKAEKIPQAAAEKMLAREIERATAAKAETAKIGDTWHQQTMADPVIGGANYEKTLENANKALALYPDAVRKAIVESEFRKNPILLHILNERGMAIPREDVVIPSGSAPAKSATPAERIYGRR